MIEMNDLFSVWQYVVSKQVYDTCSDILKHKKAPLVAWLG